MCASFAPKLQISFVHSQQQSASTSKELSTRGDPQCRSYCYFDCKLPCTFHQLLLLLLQWQKWRQLRTEGHEFNFIQNIHMLLTDMTLDELKVGAIHTDLLIISTCCSFQSFCFLLDLDLYSPQIWEHRGSKVKFHTKTSICCS